MNIAILIPTTTNNTKFKKLEDTHLFRVCVPSLMNTLSQEHKYTLYLAIDDDDKLYHKIQTKKKILNKQTYHILNKNIKINIKIISTKGINKGNVVGMWNLLHKKAYEDQNDYFIQMGDDIAFHHKNWLNHSIASLHNNQDIGVSSPVDIGNQRILTQSVVSREHMKIFGYYYPEELTNWFCDDWITNVYSDTFIFRTQTALQNLGGKPRYIPNEDKELCEELVKRDIVKLKDYINKLCN
tara:strand:- start:239 stop:958 length:720 start_codon:yes stop_codon:yes gene_type:complete